MVEIAFFERMKWNTRLRTGKHNDSAFDADSRQKKTTGAAIAVEPVSREAAGVKRGEGFGK